MKPCERALPIKRIAATVATGHSKNINDMEEPEVPIEHLQEEIHHRVSHNSERWTLGVALSSALLASFAAVASMSAGHYATETVGVKALAEHVSKKFALPWVFLDHPTGL